MIYLSDLLVRIMKESVHDSLEKIKIVDLIGLDYYILNQCIIVTVFIMWYCDSKILNS